MAGVAVSAPLKHNILGLASREGTMYGEYNVRQTRSGGDAVRCPYCHYEDSKVLDSRPTDEGMAVRRRRECLSCQRRFTTYEKVEEQMLHVIKRDGRRVAFDRGNILTGLMKACEKRPISIDELQRVTAEIELEIRNRFDREVPSTEIGELVMDKLRTLDEVAYVRFASVYRQFADIHRFREELERLFNKQQG